MASLSLFASESAPALSQKNYGIFVMFLLNTIITYTSLAEVGPNGESPFGPTNTQVRRKSSCFASDSCLLRRLLLTSVLSGATNSSLSSIKLLSRPMVGRLPFGGQFLFSKASLQSIRCSDTSVLRRPSRLSHILTCGHALHR